MKYLSFIFIVAIVVFGCELGAHKLDWNEGALQQRLKIGDKIIVEGVLGFDWNWEKNKEWGSELVLSVYNPDERQHYSIRPPIGIVICTIHNPKINKELTRLRDMYPNRSYRVQHLVRFTGKIHSFNRYETGADTPEEGPPSLPCVRIHVKSLKVINSLVE